MHKRKIKKIQSNLAPAIQSMAQIQKQSSASDTSGIHRAAAAGVQGAGGCLPYYSKIQAAFGKHDISHIKAYTGNQAASASRAIGAKAYATGNKIAFANNNPDLHTAAHEATHVIQQQAGVRLKDNVGKAGDSYERQADAIADAVVAGKSVETPLSRFNHKPHHKHQSMSMHMPVQRLMGIEAELTVPVSVQPPKGATDDMKIRQFLDGGVPERKLVEPANGGFEIVTDHDDLGKTIELFRQNLNPKLLALKKAPIGLPAPVLHKVANMEYTTNNGGNPPAYDEESRGGLRAFRQSIKNMVAHMNTRLTNAKTGVHATTGGYLYGIPPLTVFDNFAQHNGLDKKYVAGYRTKFLNMINDELYIQINAGILPKGISKYLNKLSKDDQLAKLEGLPFKMKGQEQAWVNLFTAGAATVAEQALNNTPGLSTSVKSSKSLRGLIALMVANVFGLYFQYKRQLGGIRVEPKNRVAVLPKTPLTNVLRELDKANRPDQWKQMDRDNLKTQIINHIDGYLDKTPVDRKSVVGGAAAANAGADQLVDGGTTTWQQWVENILTNKADNIFNNLLVVSTLSKVNPHDHPRSKIIDPVTGVSKQADHPRPFKQNRIFRSPVTKAKSGAIVTELRFVGARPHTNELLALVDRAVRTVKESNK